MVRSQIRLEEALSISQTGDVWLFRGPSLADRAIRLTTNSPVNHVAMAVAIDDLPPLLWHSELGQGLPDVWTGTHHRGAQLHKATDAVRHWVIRYRQRAYVRQLDAVITRGMEDRLLEVVARYDGRPFPRTAALARTWLSGRLRREVPRATVYCAQLVAITYGHMGLLPGNRPASWFDPGRFWSGDRLELADGASLGGEIEVTLD